VWGGDPLLDGDGSTGAQEAGTRHDAGTPPIAAAAGDGYSTATTNRRRRRRHRHHHHRLHHFARNPPDAQQTPLPVSHSEGQFFLDFFLLFNLMCIEYDVIK